MVRPRQIRLSPDHTSGTFQVTGRTAGHYTVRYQVFGSTADDFETPKSSPVLVSMNRSADRVNQYFRYLDTDPGLILESCCMPQNLVYSECPMSTDSVTFRSSCRWISRGSIHETSGVVFAQYRNLILPLSISGINILYDGSGEISSGLSLSPVSFCSACPANQGKLLTSRPLDPPDCYFYQFDSGDVEDMLESNSLANTFLNRTGRLTPSWFSASVLTNETSSISFNDMDIAASLVKQEDVAGIAECKSIETDDPGLYVVYIYGRGFEVSVDGGSVRYRQSNNKAVCIAFNLCQEAESPLYMGLPSEVQSIVRKLAVFSPFNRDGWQYSIDSVTLYSQLKEVSIPDMYWNGTAIYSPDVVSADLRMKTTATIKFLSTLVSVQVNFDGNILAYFPSGQVCVIYSI